MHSRPLALRCILSIRVCYSHASLAPQLCLHRTVKHHRSVGKEQCNRNHGLSAKGCAAFWTRLTSNIVQLVAGCGVASLAFSNVNILPIKSNQPLSLMCCRSLEKCCDMLSIQVSWNTERCRCSMSHTISCISLKTRLFFSHPCLTVWRTGYTKKLPGALVDGPSTTKHQGGTHGSAS